MKWASFLSRKPDVVEAFLEVAGAVEQQLNGHPAQLLLVFLSPHHASGAERMAAAAALRFPAALLAGCTGGGIIGGAREAESGPALSLTAASLPGVELSAFHVEMTGLPEGSDVSGWQRLAGCSPACLPKLILLADPFTIDAATLVTGLDRAYPAAPKIGGLASGGRRPGEHRLLLGQQVHRSGAIGVCLWGDVEVDTVVAQGCRAIGHPMIVTRCRENLLLELDCGKPLEVLAAIHSSLGAQDRDLMQHSLFVGLDMRENRVEHDPSEFLVRNIVGANEPSGSLAVGAELRPMQVVQFVLRDARTAEEDLRRQLERQSRSAARPEGALLFSCTGRGEGLFGRPDHDTGLFENLLGPAPLGGFFCNGEIGPVGGTTFLHGYTSAFGLFGQRSKQG